MYFALGLNICVMRFLFRVFLFFVLLTLHLPCKGLPRQYLDRSVIEQYLSDSNKFRPIPQAADSYWRESIPQEMRLDYIRLGYNYKGKSWAVIPDSVFSEYSVNGNRVNYELQSFAIRRQMVCLVMAEIMEYNGSLIGDIIKGFDYFIKEKWWGIPAHYTSSLPNSENQVVDLFNSETANMLVWTTYMLCDELEKERPGICELIKNEINRRILVPARENNYSWKRSTGNWNTWICANWLSCILLCETDRSQQIKDICEVLSCLDFFIDGSYDDGGCEEGVYYWDRAAASLFECVRLLAIATNGKFAYGDDEKLKAMGSFVYKTYICKSANINFSDTPSKPQININILYPFGHYVNDSLMTGYATKIAKDSNYKRAPSSLFYNSGNYPTLSRELFFLSEFETFDKCEPIEPLSRDNWLPDLQVFSARSYQQSSEGLFVAAKGGHNGENHNHNDIGSFIIYDGSTPLFVDLGAARYTAKTFSNKRYELTNCRSAYHNVPLINGFEQHVGRLYSAQGIKYKQNNKYVSFKLNLEHTYQKEAEIEKWQRTIRLNRGKNVIITEEYKLKSYLEPTEIILVCYGEPMIVKSGVISIRAHQDIHYLLYNSKQLSPVFERLEINDIAAWKNKSIYRIRLIVSDNRLQGEIRYTIK